MENNIAIQETQSKLTNLALIGLSRPTLAILNEDFPKVKKIESKQEINGLLNFLITILNIKCSSEEEKLHLDKQMILIFDLIKTKFGNLTVPEIKEAFKMYVSREFIELKVFRMLDCIVVVEILNAFINFRNESLRVYDDKKNSMLNRPAPVTQEDKQKSSNDFLIMVFEDIRKKGFSADGWLLFDKVESKFDISNKTKKRLYRLKLRQYLNELKADVADQGRRPHHVQLLEQIQKKASDGKLCGVVQNRCRSIVVCNYLKKFKTFDEFKKQIDDLD